MNRRTTLHLRGIGPVSFVGSVIISFAMLQKHHDFVVTYFVQ
jgi:hypothetical protein